MRKWLHCLLNGALVCWLLTGVVLANEVDLSGKVIFASNASGEKRIALTFDDGPHPVYTEEILDILAEYHAKATFFCIGVNAAAYPAQVQKILSAGHEIGNHTYDHENLQKVDAAGVKAEILGMENALLPVTENMPVLLRPPGGLYSDAVCQTAAALDYDVILWSVDTRDWAHTAVEEIVENVLTNTGPGDIILFHDGIAGNSPTPEALRRILPILVERGYSFCTVSELLDK